MKRFALVLAAAAILAAFLPTADAANVSFTLKADQNGWNFGEPGGSNPTLTVDQGDTVTITIQLVNSFHNWALYPGGTPPSGVSPGSGLALERTVDVTSTNPTASVTFSAPPPGSYEYYCEYHATPMHGTFIVRGNAAPAVTITAPTAATSWTGGTIHDITFTVTDDEPLTGLTAWVNYTSSVQSGTIAPAFPPSASNTVPWDVPSIDATDVRVNVTVVDSQGAFTYRESAAFEIDSTRPAVTDQFPTRGQKDVARNEPVRVTFSEGMDRAQTGSTATFGVLHVANNVWISGTISWSPDSSILTFAPDTLLDPLTTYRVHVNTSAEDDSDPGNTLLQPEIWNFITGSATDTLPPPAPDLTPVYIAIGALLAILIAALAVLMRRRKKGPRAPP